MLQFHAMNTLHKHGYDCSKAIRSLVPDGGPVLCRDEMEEWSASEANLFEEALDKYGKDFNDIRQDFVSIICVFCPHLRLYWFPRREVNGWGENKVTDWCTHSEWVLFAVGGDGSLVTLDTRDQYLHVCVCSMCVSALVDEEGVQILSDTVSVAMRFQIVRLYLFPILLGSTLWDYFCIHESCELTCPAGRMCILYKRKKVKT